MNIETISINEIIPYKNNAKIHTKNQIEQIKKSILEFGNNDPIAIDKNNIIIEGHGRLLALKELGYNEVEVIKLGHLTEEQRKAYTLIHNKLTMNTGFDLDILEEELSNIIDFDMSEFDFDIDIEDYDLEDEEENFDVDETLNSIENIRTKEGDIYKLGKHFLMCGDSTDKVDVNKLMNGQLADLFLTDPPYNVNISNSEGMQIKNDNLSNDKFKQFLVDAFKNADTYIKPGASFYVWYASKENLNFENALNETNLQVRQQLIWKKNNIVMGRQDYQWKHEPCFYGWKNGAKHNWYSDRKQTTILYYDKPLKNDLHPTMKPLELISYLINNSSKEDDYVLDLFGGSGTTLIACEQLNRTCYMMEYDPKYCDVIINRWETLTGRKSDLLND